MKGRVVCSSAGRDKGMLMVVVGSDETGIFVCDGKKRRLASPKHKNPKHLTDTGHVLEKEQLSTDKSIRRALAFYRCADTK